MLRLKINCILKEYDIGNMHVYLEHMFYLQYIIMLIVN